MQLQPTNNHPNTPNHGDMLQLADKIKQGHIKAPDVLCAGTPCQSFSVLGNKRGLKDNRGNLTLELIKNGANATTNCIQLPPIPPQVMQPPQAEKNLQELLFE